MELYDKIIENELELLNSTYIQKLVPSNWKLADENQLIFKNDTAYELGAGSLPAESQILYTSNDFIKENEIILCGPDLSEIKKDSPYARITLLKVKEGLLGTGNTLYQNLVKMDYTRYHLYPEGFMMRISTTARKETVRISKQAIKNHISFSGVGNIFIQAYLNNPIVENVKIIFITDVNFPYDRLNQMITDSENITKALDHLMNQTKMDCHTCSLQKICAEVETLCQDELTKENAK